MRALVIGAGGKIGSALCRALIDAGHEVIGTTRKEVDLTELQSDLYNQFDRPEVVYLCAAATRFIDCEDGRDAYLVNVDAPIAIARQFKRHGVKMVYLSSEAVERALHTNYGMHKALAEMGLQGVGSPTIARLSKVDPETMPDACGFLVRLANAAPGTYRWHA